MAVFIACLVLFLAMTGHSSATYCICKDGVSDSQLQKSIDYACGAGADCSPILQNGPCYNPNTIKDHCNYAVNSYYQKKVQAVGSCDFAGSAIVSSTAPTTSSGCVYPSSPSNAGSGSTNSSTSPSTTPTTLSPGSSTTTAPGFGLGPSGSGITNTDNGSVTLHHNLLTSFAVALLLCVLLCLRV